ncbi:MAG: DUF1269 domain-containing protein [Desulfomonile tiedjei]|nr:DUF1269 domain-containing protein [Desulfomonile tiedjei]
MGDLIAVEFKERCEADAFVFAIQELGEKAVLDVEDSALVFKDGENELDIDQQENLSGQLSVSGALYFGFLGAVLGWIMSGGSLGTTLFTCQAGVLLGWIAGGVAVVCLNLGVPLSLIRELGNALEPGRAISFVSVRGTTAAEKVFEQLKSFQGVVLRTSLPPAEEKKLKTALAQAH